MRCPICLNDEYVLEYHHIVPLSYGGLRDGKQIQLCTNCHLNIHRQAESVSAKSTTRRFLSPDRIKRAMPYINAIISAKIRFEQNLGSVAKEGRNLVIIEGLSSEERNALKMLRKRSGFNSVSDYLKALIRSQIKCL